MQKVLQISAGLRQGGAEAMIMNIYEKIDKSKVQFDFLVYDDAPTHYTERIKQLGGNVIFLKREHKWNIVDYKKRFMKIVSEYGPYIAVHAHTDSHSALPLTVAKQCGIKVRICNSHTTKQRENTSFIRKCYREIMRKQIIKNATILAACGTEAGYALYGKAVFQDRGVIIHNPIVINDYLCMTRNNSENGDCINIGCVGSFREAKNHAFIIKIAASLKKKGINFKMYFAGTGELENEIKKMAFDNNLLDNVIFLGLRRDIPNLMASFDLLLMPSLYEGFPVTLIESQACGLPALISDRITSEVDLGMGLIISRSLNDSIDQWIESIFFCAKIESPDISLRKKTLLEKGYDTTSVINELYRLYGVDCNDK